MRVLSGLAAALALSVAALPAFAQAPSVEAVLDTYADIALAGYEDSLTTAQALDGAIDALIAEPTASNLPSSSCCSARGPRMC